MSQLVETISLRDGKLENLMYHQNRYRNSSLELFPNSNVLELSDIFDKYKKKYPNGHYKVRFLYSNSEPVIEIENYSIRAVSSLKLVYDNSIDYRYKYANRDNLNKLFSLRGSAENILIIKNGLVTDTAYSNILFFDGENWVTPKMPLLKGVQRENLIRNLVIKEQDIKVEDIKNYKRARMINALIPFEEKLDIPTKMIY